MDRYSRSIYLGLFAVLGLTAALLAAAWTLPFPVNLANHITHTQGKVSIGSPEQQPNVIAENSPATVELKVGEQVLVEPAGTATVTFFNNGTAMLNGPASLLVRESYRKATVWEHIRTPNNADAEYHLTIEQTSGTVYYYFDDISPVLEQMTIRVRLPKEVYHPTEPCWAIEIDADGQASIGTISCTSFR